MYLTAVDRRHRRGREPRRRRTIHRIRSRSARGPAVPRRLHRRRARTWPSTTTATIPFLHSGTGPFTKMGLDNPDTMYFGTRVQPGHEYVVTGTRGTTTDVSFQLLGGEYTDDNVPDSETAFDDRKLDIAADGTFEWRFTPTTPVAVGRFARSTTTGPRSAGSFAIARTDTEGTAPPPLTRN